MKIKNIVFDLDGVLVDTDYFKILRSIGLCHTLLFIIRYLRFPTKNYFFEKIKHLKRDSQDFATHQGNRIPPIIIDWLSGNDSNKNIKKIIQNYLQKINLGILERNITNRISEVVFDPNLLVSTRKLNKNGYSLLLELSERKSYDFYILSNWDKESFALLKRKYPSIFERAKGIMISGDEHCLKPSKAIYIKFFDRFSLQKKDTLFIDDEYNNILTLEKMNCHAVHFDKTTYSRKFKDNILSELFLL